MTILERGKLIGADAWATLRRGALSGADRAAFAEPDGPEQLVRDGYARLKPVWSGAEIAGLAARAEALLGADQYVWADPEGCDHRIMGIERLDRSFRTLLDQPLFDRLHRFTSGLGYGSSTVLANRLTPRPKNLGSGGGWHRDSPFTHQFKVFVFLSDVAPENGPLTVIPGTHTGPVTAAYHRKIGAPVSAYRYTDDQIDRLVGSSLAEPVGITGPAGTVLVANTRLLHRGAPIREGSRLMATNYYFPRAIPPRLIDQFPALALPA